MRLGRMPLAVSRLVACLLKFAVTVRYPLTGKERFRPIFSELLRYPGAAGCSVTFEMENLASAVFDNEKAVQDGQG